MKTWFNQLNARGKLMVVFSLLVLVGALNITENAFFMAVIRNQKDQLLEIHLRTQKAYQLQKIVQETELAVGNFMLTGDRRWQDEFTNSQIQLNELLGQALLESTSSTEREAIYQLERANQELTANFKAIVSAANPDQTQVAYTKAEAQLQTMYPQTDLMGELGIQNYQQASEQLIGFLVISVVVTTSVLVIFIFLAILAGRVIYDQIMLPIARLTQAATALEQGRFETGELQEDARQPGEIGWLVRAFLQMAEALASRAAGLREQAEEIRGKIR